MPNAVREFAYQPAVAQVQKKQGHPVLEGTAILSCILVFLGAVAGLTWWDGRYAPSQTTTYIVQPHDTQWSIAQHFNPNTDPRKVIAWMDKHNNIASGVIVPGESLLVPESK